jgi:hypothetical protein
VIDVGDVVVRKDIVFGGRKGNGEGEVDARGWCSSGCGEERGGFVAEVVLGENVSKGAGGDDALACEWSDAERNLPHIFSMLTSSWLQMFAV